MSIIPLVASLASLIIANSLNTSSSLELLPKAKFNFNSGIIIQEITDITNTDRTVELGLESQLLKYKGISFNFNCAKGTLMKEVNPFASFYASHSPKYEFYKWNASLSHSLGKNIELSISHQHWCQHLVDNKNEAEIKSYNLEKITLTKNPFSQFQNCWQIYIGKIINPRNYDINYETGMKLEFYKFFKQFYFSYKPLINLNLTQIGQKLDENIKLGLGITNKKRTGALEFYNEQKWPSGKDVANIFGLALEIKI